MELWIYGYSSFIEFGRHEIGFLPLFRVLLQKVGEEEKFEDDEDDE